MIPRILTMIPGLGRSEVVMSFTQIVGMWQWSLRPDKTIDVHYVRNIPSERLRNINFRQHTGYIITGWWFGTFFL